MITFIGFEVHNGELYARFRFTANYNVEWDSCSCYSRCWLDSILRG